MLTGHHRSAGAAGRGLDIIVFFSVVAYLTTLPSCSHRYTDSVRTEIQYRDRVRVDTAWIRDSVHVKEFVKGDTVYVKEIRDHLVYRYKYIRDTLALRDSVVIERVKEVKVEKPLTGWQRFRIGAFYWLLAIAAALAAWTFRKPLLRIFGIG